MPVSLKIWKLTYQDGNLSKIKLVLTNEILDHGNDHVGLELIRDRFRLGDEIGSIFGDLMIEPKRSMYKPRHLWMIFGSRMVLEAAVSSPEYFG